eukprot:Gb_20281 [translate_table: standard]
MTLLHMTIGFAEGLRGRLQSLSNRLKLTVYFAKKINKIKKFQIGLLRGDGGTAAMENFSEVVLPHFLTKIRDSNCSEVALISGILWNLMNLKSSKEQSPIDVRSWQVIFYCLCFILSSLSLSAASILFTEVAQPSSCLHSFP